MSKTNDDAQNHTPSVTSSGNNSATTGLILAADTMHAELLLQCRALMGAEAGTPESEKLDKLATMVERYERHRWPI